MKLCLEEFCDVILNLDMKQKVSECGIMYIDEVDGRGLEKRKKKIKIKTDDKYVVRFDKKG